MTTPARQQQCGSEYADGTCGIDEKVCDKVGCKKWLSILNRHGIAHGEYARQSQHCDHERVCMLFRYGSIVAWHDKTPCMRNHEGCKTCDHDTRSRTHTSPPAPAVREMFAEHQAYRNGYDDGYALAMNEAGDKIKAAREQVLKKMVNILAAHTINSDDFAKDGIKSGWILVGGYEPIIDDIESLRAQQGGVSE